jgi:hypothetical protein
VRHTIIGRDQRHGIHRCQPIGIGKHRIIRIVRRFAVPKHS